MTYQKIPWTEEPGVHGVAKSWTRLSDFTFFMHLYILLFFFWLSLSACGRSLFPKQGTHIYPYFSFFPTYPESLFFLFLNWHAQSFLIATPPFLELSKSLSIGWV